MHRLKISLLLSQPATYCTSIHREPQWQVAASLLRRPAARCRGLVFPPWHATQSGLFLAHAVAFSKFILVCCRRDNAADAAGQDDTLDQSRARSVLLWRRGAYLAPGCVGSLASRATASFQDGGHRLVIGKHGPFDDTFAVPATPLARQRPATSCQLHARYDGCRAPSTANDRESSVLLGKVARGGTGADVWECCLASRVRLTGHVCMYPMSACICGVSVYACIACAGIRTGR